LNSDYNRQVLSRRCIAVVVSYLSEGLNTVNLGDVTAFQQAVFAILLLIGNITFVSTFVVLVRRHFFRRKLADMVDHSNAARKVVDDVELRASEKSIKGARLAENISSKIHPGRHHADITTRQRRTTAPNVNDRVISSRKQSLPHQTGFGTFPAPWEIEKVRQLAKYPFRKVSTPYHHKDHSYLSFKAKFDERGRFRELNEMERRELGGVEYRALGVLLHILIAYQVFWLVLGTAFLVPYSYRSSIVEILNSSQPGNLNPGWFAFFSVLTSYCNGEQLETWL
jgi:hypothetical protein